MAWTQYHRRGEILRDVIAVAAQRGDGLLPMDLDGVAERFTDELDLLGAIQLRWHTRLTGHIERRLAEQPLDLESAIVDAWHAAVDEMPGGRAVIDRCRARPQDARMAEAMAVATRKEHVLLAVMAGRGGYDDALAAPVGAAIEERARATYRPGISIPAPRTHTLLERIRSALAA